MTSEPTLGACAHSTHGARVAPPLRNALLLAYAWLNLSEVFRYFLFVMPTMRATLPQIADVAPMNIPVFLIWGAWDTVLFCCVSFFIWLYFERFGGGARSVLAAGTLAWTTVFCLFWVAVWNMNLSGVSAPLTALPLGWVEMVAVAAFLERGWRASPKPYLREE
jgi:hypothetical protein